MDLLEASDNLDAPMLTVGAEGGEEPQEVQDHLGLKETVDGFADLGKTWYCVGGLVLIAPRPPFHYRHAYRTVAELFTVCGHAKHVRHEELGGFHLVLIVNLLGTIKPGL